jgi:hypothetical protein
VTLSACFNDFALVVFPGCDGMDSGVAIGTGNTVRHVNTQVVLRGDLPVAPLALYFAGYQLPIFMPFHIGQLNVAAGAAVFAVNGCVKGGSGNFVSVATETDRWRNRHVLFGRRRKSECKEGENSEQDNRNDSGGDCHRKPPGTLPMWPVEMRGHGKRRKTFISRDKINNNR